MYNEFNKDFNKHFENVSGVIKTTAIISLVISILGGIASLGIVGTIIYLLLKNFG